MKKTRKFLAVLLALVMTLALAAPALAAEGDDKEVTGGTTTVEVTTIMVLPTIKVYVSAPPSIVVNPYGMAYTNSTLGISGDSSTLMSTATAIISKSDIGITVKASPTATPTGNVTMATTPGAVDDAETPTAYMFLTLQNLTSNDVTVTGDVTKINVGTPASPATVPTWATSTQTDGTTVVIGTTAPATPATIDLAAGGTSSPQYGGFKIVGATGGPWVDGTDSISVSVVLTFVAKTGTGSSGS